jgi:hypothetical protein
MRYLPPRAVSQLSRMGGGESKGASAAKASGDSCMRPPPPWYSAFGLLGLLGRGRVQPP